ELLAQIRRCRRDAWVHTDLEGLIKRLVADGEADGVLPWRRVGTGEHILRGDVALGASGVGVPHVPDKAVAPHLLRHVRLFLLLRLLALGARLLSWLLAVRLGLRLLLLLASEALNLLALRVEEGQRHLALGLLLEVVRNGNAVRRILARIEVDLL